MDSADVAVRNSVPMPTKHTRYCDRSGWCAGYNPPLGIFRYRSTHDPTQIGQYILPSTFLAEIKPGRGAHIQHMCWCGTLKIQDIIIAQVHLEEAHVILRRIDDYNTVGMVRVVFRSSVGMEGLVLRCCHGLESMKPTFVVNCQ